LKQYIFNIIKYNNIYKVLIHDNIKIFFCHFITFYNLVIYNKDGLTFYFNYVKFRLSLLNRGNGIIFKF